MRVLCTFLSAKSQLLFSVNIFNFTTALRIAYEPLLAAGRKTFAQKLISKAIAYITKKPGTTIRSTLAQVLPSITVEVPHHH